MSDTTKRADDFLDALDLYIERRFGIPRHYAADWTLDGRRIADTRQALALELVALLAAGKSEILRPTGDQDR